MTKKSGGSRLTAYACRHCESVVLDEVTGQCCGEEMAPVDVEAVKEPNLAVLLPTVFGVSQTGVDVCVYVMEHEEATIEEIARALDINRSTVTRQLNQLQDLGVVACREESLAEGGRIQLFSPVPLEKVRRRHLEGLLSWVTDAIAVVNEIDKRKLKAASQTGQAESTPEPRADE